MVASGRKRADAAVAIKRYVRAVGETLTSQVRGLFLVVGNGDGRRPLRPGYLCRAVCWTGVFVQGGQALGRDSKAFVSGVSGGGVSRAERRIERAEERVAA